MKFEYKKFPIPYSDAFSTRHFSSRPVIPIIIKNPVNGRTIGYEALIDSGADFNILPAEVGEIIGLDIKNGKMTYPIIMMLELANQDDRKKIISALEGNLQNEQYEDLTKIFVNSGAYGKCKALARDYQRKALDMAREFPEPASFLLSRLSIMLASNRYYATFTQIKEIQK